MNSLILFIIGLLISLSVADTVADFQLKLFKPAKPQGLWTVNTGEQVNGQLLCFGDINGDKYTDYVATPNRQKQIIYFYFWDKDNLKFVLDEYNLTIEIKFLEQIMIYDIDGDGSNEMILTYRNIQQEQLCLQTFRIICENNQYHCSYAIHPLKIINMTAMPFIIDLQGNGYPSIFIFKNQERYLVSHKGENSRTNFINYLTNGENIKLNKVQKHFSSMIDFTGDCLADLIMVSNSQTGPTIEFYQKQSQSNFKKIKQIPLLNQNIQQLTFADLDNNGAIDIILLIKNKNKIQMKIIYNQNKPNNLCQNFKQFSYNFNQLQIINLPYQLSNSSVLMFGDINYDGYPDLLSIFKVNKFNVPYLLINTFNQKKIYFEELKNVNNPLSSLKNIKQAALFDLGETGKLGMLIFSQQTNEQDEKQVIRISIINNLQEDYFFLKILPLSPISTTESKSISGACGVTVQWIITNLDGTKSIEISSQKFQWNYKSMQLPYSISGLGRTNNYVEDLVVGFQKKDQRNTWTPIIPNSQLVVYSKNGKLDMLLSNSQRQNIVIYVAFLFLLILALVVLILNWKQQQEDKKDHYNFIQLIR